MLSEDEVKHIAKLARIGMKEEEVEKFSHDLSNILNWMEKIKEVETEKAEAMELATELKNKKREDKVSDFESAEKIYDLFPEKKNGYNKVKSVL